jgi:hypothetical protein
MIEGISQGITVISLTYTFGSLCVCNVQCHAQNAECHKSALTQLTYAHRVMFAPREGGPRYILCNLSAGWGWVPQLLYNPERNLVPTAQEDGGPHCHLEGRKKTRPLWD